MIRSLLLQACFAPVSYFVHLYHRPVIIEKHSNYSRQTYRNRYEIMGANGFLSLSIPIEKSKEQKIADKDVRIAYHTPWQKTHWRSLISAYNSSPFFEFYRDDLEPFFTGKYNYLLDFNLKAIEVMTDLLGFEADIILSEEYINNPGEDILDTRESIHPKRDQKENTGNFESVAYKQVFDDRHGFAADLSILDLLFNKGPEAQLILENSL
jgi:hypothetical protein